MSQKEELVDVNLYIDELKSDDPMLKLNAISKLEVIAGSLSQARVEEELLPYLTFIITELDNEDEFLLKLSENLFNYLKEHTAVKKVKSLNLFEPLASLEDQQIRQSAVKGLLLVAEENSSEVFHSIYRMVNFSIVSKVSALEVIAGLLKNNTFDSTLFKECEKIVMVLLQDSSLTVRRAAMRALTAFWQSRDKLTAKNIKTSDIKLFTKAFLLDFLKIYDPLTTEAVLFEAFNENLIKVFVNQLEETNISQLIDSCLVLLNSKEVSWRVKYMVLSSHALLSQDATKLAGLVQIMKRLFKEEEQEVKSVIVRALGGLFQTIDSTKTISELWDLTQAFIKTDIAAEKNSYVKESYVELLRQMLVNKSHDANISKFSIELFAAAFTDFTSETKLRSLDFVESFFCRESIENRDQMFTRLEMFAQDKNWRIKLELLEKMGKVLTVLIENDKPTELVERIVDLCMKFKDDLVFAVRSKVLDNLILLMSRNFSSTVKESIKEVLLGWASNRNYIFRVSGLQGLTKVTEILDATWLSQLTTQMYDLLSTEAVPNVRINMLKTIIAIKDSVNSLTWKNITKKLSADWINDTDRDVKSLLGHLSQVTATA